MLLSSPCSRVAGHVSRASISNGWAGAQTAGRGAAARWATGDCGAWAALTQRPPRANAPSAPLGHYDQPRALQRQRGAIIATIGLRHFQTGLRQHGRDLRRGVEPQIVGPGTA